MKCISTGLITLHDFSPPIHVSVNVSARSMTDDPRFWAGLALNSNVIADDTYAQIAITQGIEPYVGVHTPHIVHLTTPTDLQCCDLLTEAAPATQYALSLSYDGTTAVYTVGNIKKSVKVKLDDPFFIEVLCVAVNPGELNNTSVAHSEFTDLIVVEAEK